jgi:hypothetical protein
MAREDIADLELAGASAQLLQIDNALIDEAIVILIELPVLALERENRPAGENVAREGPREEVVTTNTRIAGKK